jgi:tetratricopeptide (TPR) repeat protein
VNVKHFVGLTALLLITVSVAHAQGSRSDSAISYYNRGNTWYSQGELERAIEDYDFAIAFDPRCAEAYCNRGLARYDMRDVSGAIADFTRAVELSPKLADAYYNRGVARLVQRSLESAIADFDRAIKLKPRFSLPYLCRGIALVIQGNELEGERDFKKFRDLGGIVTQPLGRIISEAREGNRLPGVPVNR